MTVPSLVILNLILGYTACARLDNLYLPPSQRGAATFGEGTSSRNFEASNAGDFGRYSGGIQESAGGFGTSSGRRPTAILKFNADNNGDGRYRYNYETANSISAEEQGEARGDGSKVYGSYSYISPEGERISITYTADENGFVPQGSHIPTPPPIPEAILKSLQENAAAEARGIFDDGQYRGEGLNEGRQQGTGAFGKSNNGGFSGYRY
ncbi:endocuticle structural glycoprotein SgAbd-2-like [Euwallacea fornicatus]|uniref:endocuticle structural glycoprotein SgAbd-2-like n=1 Tax=Euwallacea fornicatus TaxID=995702 RepID=UPI00338FAD0D